MFLERWIRDLLFPLRGNSFDSVYKDGLNLLIEMAQLEILHEELPQVLTDAAAQQAEWNRFRLPFQKETETATPAKAKQTRYARFETAPGFVDPALATVAAVQTIGTLQASWAIGAAVAAAPRETPIGKFFEQDYAVASETVESGLPALTAAGLLTHTLIVVNNCIMGSIGQPLRSKISKNPIYIFGISLPLRTSHGLVQLWTRAPVAVAVFHTVLATASIVALLIAFKWYDEILLPPGKPFPRMWWLILVVAPLIILLLQARMSKTILRVFLWALAIFAGITLLVFAFSRLVPFIASFVGKATPYALMAIAILIGGGIGFWLGSTKYRTE